VEGSELGYAFGRKRGHEDLGRSWEGNSLGRNGEVVRMLLILVGSYIDCSTKDCCNLGFLSCLKSYLIGEAFARELAVKPTACKAWYLADNLRTYHIDCLTLYLEQVISTFQQISSMKYGHCEGREKGGRCKV